MKDPFIEYWAKLEREYPSKTFNVKVTRCKIVRIEEIRESSQEKEE